MAKTSYEEAALVLQVNQWGAMQGLGGAMNWIWSDEFVPDFAGFAAKYPPGSDGARNVALVCTYFETLGTLWKHGLVSEGFLFDLIAVGMYWERLSAWALGVRQGMNNARLWENFESLAGAQANYDAKLSKRAGRSKKRKK